MFILHSFIFSWPTRLFSVIKKSNSSQQFSRTHHGYPWHFPVVSVALSSFCLAPSAGPRHMVLMASIKAVSAEAWCPSRPRVGTKPAAPNWWKRYGKDMENMFENILYISEIDISNETCLRTCREYLRKPLSGSFMWNIGKYNTREIHGKDGNENVWECLFPINISTFLLVKSPHLADLSPSLSLSENPGLRKKKHSIHWLIIIFPFIFIPIEMAINWSGLSQIFNAKRQELEAAQPLWPLAMLRPCYGNRWKSKGFPFQKKGF